MNFPAPFLRLIFFIKCLKQIIIKQKNKQNKTVKTEKIFDSKTVVFLF